MLTINTLLLTTFCLLANPQKFVESAHGNYNPKNQLYTSYEVTEAPVILLAHYRNDQVIPADVLIEDGLVSAFDAQGIVRYRVKSFDAILIDGENKVRLTSGGNKLTAEMAAFIRSSSSQEGKCILTNIALSSIAGRVNNVHSVEFGYQPKSPLLD